MPRLSSEKINEIRQSVDIVDVIGTYLPLEKKGRNYVAICPFHDDSHPSMSIYVFCLSSWGKCFYFFKGLFENTIY